MLFCSSEILFHKLSQHKPSASLSLLHLFWMIKRAKILQKIEYWHNSLTSSATRLTPFMSSYGFQRPCSLHPSQPKLGRLAPQYQSRQRVWLSSWDLPLKVKSRKLIPWLIGPFEVDKVINPSPSASSCRYHSWSTPDSSWSLGASDTTSHKTIWFEWSSWPLFKGYSQHMLYVFSHTNSMSLKMAMSVDLSRRKCFNFQMDCFQMECRIS